MIDEQALAQGVYGTERLKVKPIILLALFYYTWIGFGVSWVWKRSFRVAYYRRQSILSGTYNLDVYPIPYQCVHIYIPFHSFYWGIQDYLVSYTLSVG